MSGCAPAFKIFQLHKARCDQLDFYQLHSIAKQGDSALGSTFLKFISSVRPLKAEPELNYDTSKYKGHLQI